MSTDWITTENVNRLDEILDELKEVNTKLKVLAENNQFQVDNEDWQTAHGRQMELLAEWRQLTDAEQVKNERQ